MPPGLTTSTWHCIAIELPLASLAETSQMIVSPTPPLSTMVSVPPSVWTTQEAVLSMRLPFLVNLKQS